MCTISGSLYLESFLMTKLDTLSGFLEPTGCYRHIFDLESPDDMFLRLLVADEEPDVDDTDEDDVALPRHHLFCANYISLPILPRHTFFVLNIFLYQFYHLLR